MRPVWSQSGTSLSFRSMSVPVLEDKRHSENRRQHKLPLHPVMAALLSVAADVWDSPGGLKVHNIIIHNIILIIITFFISEGRGQGSGTPETPEI